jgi:hypothetical protein
VEELQRMRTLRELGALLTAGSNNPGLIMYLAGQQRQLILMTVLAAGSGGHDVSMK